MSDDRTNGGTNGRSNGAQNGAPSNAGTVRPTDITNEMQVAYLDYAMSVIVARALPDVRDGLKPVHRRILYAIWHDLGLTADKPHKKSARIVGEVLGKYHPHGDTAVYDAMVRMAQPFSLRYPLIDGQGNFGSIDGDNAAAMRYTEARLARISHLMLEDLEKDTVDWHANFDNTLREPDIVPAALPNLLVNGSSGIAVGMATNIPPHNLGEVVDALAYMIDHHDAIDDITAETLMEFIKGPDFPTGGILYRFREEAKGESGNADGNVDAIAHGYSTGKARLIMQAKAHFEEMARGRLRIIITELPYQTNKTALLERIADLVRDGKVEGISDLRDESDRTGMRVVIELKRDVDAKSILADLYKYTPLQQTFGMQLLALVDGEPRMLTLKRILQHFIQHRQEIIRRRSEYDLARARERVHIVEGLLRALDILDEVIATIRKSQTVDTARKNLIANFKFSELQAQAILDMQLRRLAALERKKLQEEHDELRKRIKWLEELLANPAQVLALIKTELLEIKQTYGDARRTQIVDLTKGAHTTHDLLPEEDVWVSVGTDGELRRQHVGRQTPANLRQAAKGAEAALLTANTRELLYLFTAAGRCAKLGIHEIPAEGAAKHMSDLGLFTRRDKVAAALTLPRSNGEETTGFVLLATEKGVVKRISAADLAAITGDALVMNVEEKDKLGWALRTTGDQEVMLITNSGQAIRFAEDEVRAMGLAAGGVGGIKLEKNERVIHATLALPDGFLLSFSASGFAKLSALGEYPRQGRNGGGVVAHKLSARTGDLGAAAVLAGDALPKLLAVTFAKGTPKVMEMGEVPRLARSTQGKLIVEVPAGAPPINGVRYVEGGEPAEPPAANTRPRLLDEESAPKVAVAKPAAAPAPVKLEPRKVENAPAATKPAGAKFVSAKPEPAATPAPPPPAKKAPEPKPAAAKPASTGKQPGLFADEPPAKGKPSKLNTVTSVKKKGAQK